VNVGFGFALVVCGGLSDDQRVVSFHISEATNSGVESFAAHRVQTPSTPVNVIQ